MWNDQKKNWIYVVLSLLGTQDILVGCNAVTQEKVGIITWPNYSSSPQPGYLLLHRHRSRPEITSFMDEWGHRLPT